ncbi:hypothetical protein ACFQZ4_21830 [Catellatospora coxensis]
MDGADDVEGEVYVEGLAVLGVPAPSVRCVSASRRLAAIIVQSSADTPTRRIAAAMAAASAGAIAGRRSPSTACMRAAS